MERRSSSQGTRGRFSTPSSCRSSPPGSATTSSPATERPCSERTTRPVSRRSWVRSRTSCGIPRGTELRSAWPSPSTRRSAGGGGLRPRRFRRGRRLHPRRIGARRARDRDVLGVLRARDHSRALGASRDGEGKARERRQARRRARGLATRGPAFARDDGGSRRGTSTLTASPEARKRRSSTSSRVTTTTSCSRRMCSFCAILPPRSQHASRALTSRSRDGTRIATCGRTSTRPRAWSRLRSRPSAGPGSSRGSRSRAGDGRRGALREGPPDPESLHRRPGVPLRARVGERAGHGRGRGDDRRARRGLGRTCSLTRGLTPLGV